MTDRLVHLRTGEAVDVGRVPASDFAAFRETVLSAVAEGARVSAMFGMPADASRNAAGTRIVAILADDAAGTLTAVATTAWTSLESLTPACPQVHLFEREIHEQWAVTLVGHPWPKPVRFHAPYAGTTAEPPVIGVTDFYAVEGAEEHEVAVGPVHAGIIEPGHFRFQCHGETVHHLEISLGYQHRGVERALVGGPTGRTIHLVETLAGDTTVAHATAYAQAVEALAGAAAPPRALALRAIALELERLANHTGDLGALAGDVGYLPTQSFCGRIRGDFLNMTALVCGNRFGRSLVVPGGTGFDIFADRVVELVARLDRALADVTVAVSLLWNTPSVLGRFERIGIVSRRMAVDLGLVGPAARATGLERDVRRDFPSGMYRFAQVPVSTWATGDVYARAFVRWLEIQRSVAFVRDLALNLPAGACREACGALRPGAMAVSLVEGWRGEVCHVAITGPDGRFAHYKVVDPSFHNWSGLAMALRDEQISDFPLCNKSFDLSYCGYDL